MLETFCMMYPRDRGNAGEVLGPVRIQQFPELDGFLSLFGGASFGGSLYRIARPDELPRWNERIALAFPERAKTICCFSYDWLGRAYALDSELREEGRAGVRMFEPGTGDTYLTDANLETLHERVFVESGDELLAVDYFRDWRAAGGEAPAADACIGYRIPLFLGGEDEIANLEMSDLDVYWDLMGQIIIQIRDLPPGTPIRSVRIKDA